MRIPDIGGPAFAAILLAALDLAAKAWLDDNAQHDPGAPLDLRVRQDGRPRLHHVRDGACGIFGTVLSPDYNAAHGDHLHLDQAGHGFGGPCR